MTVRVGYYLPGIDSERVSAPERCLLNLIEAVRDVDSIDPILIGHDRSALSVDGVERATVPRMPLVAARAVARVDPDLLHYNTVLDGLVVPPELVDVGTVLSVHGDLHWEFPSFIGPLHAGGIRLIERARLSAFDGLLPVSHDLKRRVVRRYPSLDERTRVVPNGVDHERYRPRGASLPSTYGVEPPYVLHVSNYSPKKNPAGVLEGYRRAHGSLKDVSLVICGEGWVDNERVSSRLRASGMESEVHRVGFVPVADLAAFYREASVFLYPSLHETFGLPVVESMACGTPVVTADRYATAEVAGDAALTCDPTDYGEIAEAVSRLLTDDALHETLRERGLERAASFTWERSASRAVEVYSDLAG